MLDRATFEDESQLDEMGDNAKRATEFLKAMAHEGRLMILCYLASGEKSVTELETLLSMRQPSVSQQLARLRIEGLIEARREGKQTYYRICDERAAKLIDTVYGIFCKTG